MKYKINGKVIAAEELTRQPDAKLWITAIQKAQELAFAELQAKFPSREMFSPKEVADLLDEFNEDQLARIGMEIVE